MSMLQQDSARKLAARLGDKRLTLTKLDLGEMEASGLELQAEVDTLRALLMESVQTVGVFMPTPLIRRIVVALDWEGPR